MTSYTLIRLLIRLRAVVRAFLSVWSVYKREEMASQGEGSQKWKRKRMLEAKAEKMRAAKKARQQETREERGGDGSGRDDEAGPSTSRVGDAPESEDDGPHQSGSENDRGSSESFESDFGDDEAQDIFDDWVVSLPALQRKTRAVLLMQSFRTRQKMSTGQEAASITGFNEKTVRLFQEREL